MNRDLLRRIGIGMGAVLAAGFLWMGLSHSGCDAVAPPRTNPTGPGVEAAANLQELFTRGTELSACRAGLQQLSAAQVRQPELRPKPLEDETRKFLQEKVGLNQGELSEVEVSAYTPLDAHYLEECFLLRDAAQSLDAEKLPALDKATLAFAWTCRQIRLVNDAQTITDLPPQLALRTGVGSYLDRTRVFIALLNQLDVTACLLLFPHKTQENAFLPLCGVLAQEEGKPALFLFDPINAGPLPGPDGKGIATLKSVASKPHLLAPISLDEKLQYQTQPKKIHLLSPLSAAAPRLKLLEDRLMGTATQVRLTVDAAGQFRQVQEAARGVGLKDELVTFLPGAAAQMRSFLPVSEGGTDRPQQVSLKALSGYALERDRQLVYLTTQQIVELSLVPWTQFPEALRNLPPNDPLWLAPRRQYEKLFAPFTTANRDVHDQILRGQFDEARGTLGLLCDRLRDLREAYQRPDFTKKAQDWGLDVGKRYNAYLRAEADAKQQPAAYEDARRSLVALLSESGGMLSALLEGSSADARLERATYLLALCLQEQAERKQERVRRAGEQALERDSKEARAAWVAAEQWWFKYNREFGNGLPGPAARQHWARCRLMLGELDAAAERLRDDSGAISELEKAVRKWQAEQLKSK